MKRIAMWGALPMVLWVGAIARVEAAGSIGDRRSPIADGATGRRGDGATARADAGERVTLDVRGAQQDALAQALTKALKAEVRIDGTLVKAVDVKLEGVPHEEALSRIAAITEGEWRRAILWKVGEKAGETLTKEGRVLNLNLKQAPCRTAASVVAAVVGALSEGHEALTGRVSLSGRELPLADALAAIARASGASWKEILVLRLENAPDLHTATARKPTRTRKNTMSMGSRKRPIRSKYTMLAKFGARPEPPVVVDPAVAEERAKLGAFAGVFSIQDKEERLQKVRKLRAAIETQIRRMENYRPEFRRLASEFEIQQLRAILADYESLTDTQKEEVKLFVDFVRKRLTKIESRKQSTESSKPAPAPAATDGAGEAAKAIP
jgi:hypothetical protein